MTAEMRLPLATVRSRLAELSATGAVVMCTLTRYDGGKTIEALECRLSGVRAQAGAGEEGAGAEGVKTVDVDYLLPDPDSGLREEARNSLGLRELLLGNEFLHDFVAEA